MSGCGRMGGGRIVTVLFRDGLRSSSFRRRALQVAKLFFEHLVEAIGWSPHSSHANAAQGLSFKVRQLLIQVAGQG